MKLDITTEVESALETRVGKLLQGYGIKKMPDEKSELARLACGDAVRCFICRSICTSSKGDDKYLCFSCGVTARKDGNGIYDNMTKEQIFRRDGNWIKY